MPIEKTITTTKDWRKDKFVTTPVMSTYLLAFVIADFKSREQKSENGPEVGNLHCHFKIHLCNFWLLPIHKWMLFLEVK